MTIWCPVASYLPILAKYTNLLPTHLLNAEEACSPVKWKDRKPLIVSQWMCLVNDLQNIEDLTLVLQHLPRTVFKHMVLLD